MKFNQLVIELIVLSWAICCYSTIAIKCHPDERESLLNFVQSDDNIADLQWDLKADCCAWYAIGCDPATGHIISIDISVSHIPLFLPPNSSLFHLSHLQHLDLSGNQMESTSIPEEIGNLRNLTYLSFSGSSIGGTIPRSIGSLTKLVTLDLSLNKLSGAIPETLGNLNSLSHLDLSVNGLSGTISDSIGNLRSLTYLDLSKNRFTGNIPASFIKLTQLVTLHLSGNPMKGKYPDFIGSFPSLQDLSLSNAFSGGIPNSIGNLTSLQNLKLGNGVTGNLPEWLLNLPNLVTLHLEDNFLDGPLPTNIRVDSKLTDLYLTNNNLTGKIPSWLFNRAVQMIHFENNKFTGPFEGFAKNSRSSSVINVYLDGNKLTGAVDWSELRNTTSLQVFSVKGNRGLDLKNSNNALFNLDGLGIIDFTDCGVTEFPNFLQTLESLDTLSLGNNKMRGAINFEEGWNELSYLDVSENMIGGTLPPRPPNLRLFNVSRNNMNGGIPWGSLNLSAYPFETFDLSYNGFSGVIPSALGDVPNLVDIDFSNNRFSGGIPESLGKLPLVSLDLSFNMLSGRIPSSVVNIGPLVFLNLSYNHLYGPIPQGKLFPKESYIGNKGLCGPPLTPKC